MVIFVQKPISTNPGLNVYSLTETDLSCSFGILKQVIYKKNLSSI
mgnify:CR=1 FL=1